MNRLKWFDIKNTILCLEVECTICYVIYWGKFFCCTLLYIKYPQLLMYKYLFFFICRYVSLAVWPRFKWFILGINCDNRNKIRYIKTLNSGSIAIYHVCVSIIVSNKDTSKIYHTTISRRCTLTCWMAILHIKARILILMQGFSYLVKIIYN